MLQTTYVDSLHCQAFIFLFHTLLKTICKRIPNMLCPVGLLFNVPQNFAEMWKQRNPSSVVSLLCSIEIDNPLAESNLRDFHQWWQHVETPQLIQKQVKEFAMDGHEKITTRCNEAPPARAGRPRKDGEVKLTNNGWGWFMLTDPSSGYILGIKEMKQPENAEIASSLMEDLLPLYPKEPVPLWSCLFCVKESFQALQDEEDPAMRRQVPCQGTLRRLQMLTTESCSSCEKSCQD